MIHSTPALDDTLLISGGWDPFFGARDPEASTVVHGGGTAPVVRAELIHGRLVLTGLTVAAGSRPHPEWRGGGISIAASGTAQVLLDGNHVVENLLLARPDGVADGGGLEALLHGGRWHRRYALGERRDGSGNAGGGWRGGGR